MVLLFCFISSDRPNVPDKLSGSDPSGSFIPYGYFTAFNNNRYLPDTIGMEEHFSKVDGVLFYIKILSCAVG